MRTRQSYLPIFDLEPGMVLAHAANVVTQGVLRFSLPAGHTLSEENIRHLVAHQAEFVYIAEPDRRSDEQVAVDAALAAKRVMEIFRGADLEDPVMASLFDQVLGYRSA
jgi:hypothetical protein